MTRAATNDNENYLLTIAKHGTASHMEQLVKKFQKVKGRQQGSLNNEQEKVTVKLPEETRQMMTR